MNSNHTPGPWQVSKAGLLTNEGEVPVLNYDDPDNPKRICLVSLQDENIKKKDRYFAPCAEREANARLIAAAPALYTACVEVLRAYDNHLVKEEQITQIRQALALVSNEYLK